MFYTEAVLTKQGPLARIWLAAHWDKKLTKAVVFETNLESACESVINPSVKLALRTSGHLLLGVVRIYNRKARYLLADCNEAFMKIKLAFRSGLTIDLPKDQDNAKNQIFLPDDLDDLTVLPEISQNELQSAMLRNTARIEEITRKHDARSLQHSGIFRDLLRNNDYEDDDFGLGTNFDEWDDPSDAAANTSKSIEKGRREDSRNKSTSILEKRAHRVDPEEMEVDIMKELNENQDNDLDIFGAGVIEDDPPPPPMETTPMLDATAQGPMVQFEDISKVQSPGGIHDHMDSPPMDIPSPMGADDDDMGMMPPPMDMGPPATPGDMHMPPTPLQQQPGMAPSPIHPGHAIGYVPSPGPPPQQMAQSPLMLDPNQMVHQQQLLQQQQQGMMQQDMQMQMQIQQQQQQQPQMMHPQGQGMLQQGMIQQYDAMGQPIPSPGMMQPMQSPMHAPSPMMPPSPHVQQGHMLPPASPGMPPSPGYVPSPLMQQPHTPGMMQPPTPQEADKTHLGSDNQLVLSPLHPSQNEAAPQPHRQPRVRKKRKLLVDGMMEITNSMMKSQLKDYSDIVLPVETNYDWLAPPTIRLVQWKEHGTTDPLFKHNFVGDKNRDKMEYLQGLQYAPGSVPERNSARNTSRDKSNAPATPVTSRKRTASKDATVPVQEAATPAPPPPQENQTMPPPAVTPLAPERDPTQPGAPALQDPTQQSTPAPEASQKAPEIEMSSIQQAQDSTMAAPPPPPPQPQEDEGRPQEKRARFDEANLEQTKGQQDQEQQQDITATGEKSISQLQNDPTPPLETTANPGIASQLAQLDVGPPSVAPASVAPPSVAPPSAHPLSPAAPEKSLEESFAHINFKHLDDDKKRDSCMMDLISADMERQNVDDASFFNISHAQDRKRAARQFYSLLVLRKQKIIEVTQNGPCEDISITKNENWVNARDLLMT